MIDWQLIYNLKAFSRVRNIQQPTHVVAMTFDTIYGLHEIAQERAEVSGDTAERGLGQRGDGAISKHGNEFSGGSRYERQTTKTLSGAALNKVRSGRRSWTRYEREKYISGAKNTASNGWKG